MCSLICFLIAFLTVVKDFLLLSVNYSFFFICSIVFSVVLKFVISLSVDMWSVGCILGEMITRRPLFKGVDRILFVF